MDVSKMNPIAVSLKVAMICIVALFVRIEGLANLPISLANSSKTASCAAPENRQFDFWVGDWDAFYVDSPAIQVARTRVDLILDGCVLQEDYEGANGLKGQSFTMYDASRNVWHQSWVTNRGQLLVIEGKLKLGEMLLSGVDHAANGESLVRGTWKPADGGVRETAVTSTDGGKTWNPWFDLLFRPHTELARSNAAVAGNTRNIPIHDDQKIVAELDTQYQAAVKKNDAATMDHLLADDFVLVTGFGKAYRKADLVNDARGGHVVYEHQEDTAQTVRVWGNTAVVTAKLWEKGTDNGKSFDYTVWFSDTYVRTLAGWRYVFGQSSLPLPHTP